MTAATEETYLRRALTEARAAFEAGEVPVGAVVVLESQVIGRGHNQRETLHDPTAHAEMLALTAAANHLGDWRLAGCTMYVTKEPCAMCAGALVNARVKRLVFGAWDEEAGAAGSLYQLCRDPRFNHQVEVHGGVLEGECRGLLETFFRRRRAESQGERSGE
ncbi:MAG: tRNA adenosine(34) deaminase TadA [Candidatus Neomarinimicrobiota bacterium]